jgi:superfamily I DNA and RNA helicase
LAHRYCLLYSVAVPAVPGPDKEIHIWHTNDEPDWSHIHILHAWGSFDRSGFYASVAERVGVPIRNWSFAKATYGRTNAFHGVCTELLNQLDAVEAPAIFDAVLIDEAQDLPTPFFRIAHRVCKKPKRLIWAYDELQNLSDFSMDSVQDLFGRDSHGQPNIVLRNRDDEPRQDIILRVCYRNTPWALVTAHALGFGIYRQKHGLVQFFDDPQLWEDIGYEIADGAMLSDKNVTLRRKADSYPPYFNDLLKPDDAVSYHAFDTGAQQADWVAEQVHKNLNEDELRHTDIMIVLPDAITAASEGFAIVRALDKRGISAHVAGNTSSQDQLFTPNSVAVCHIHRAKGNEAPSLLRSGTLFSLRLPDQGLGCEFAVWATQ